MTGWLTGWEQEKQVAGREERVPEKEGAAKARDLMWDPGVGKDLKKALSRWGSCASPKRLTSCCFGPSRSPPLGAPKGREQEDHCVLVRWGAGCLGRGTSSFSFSNSPSVDSTPRAPSDPLSVANRNPQFSGTKGD